ncbi:MAG: hypothetical protein C4K60_08350 [Ideonella sp. MAG2]|nr:MAG: hypothetical protein C4K60_08350 [Ideonella sp. MAG2]
MSGEETGGPFLPGRDQAFGRQPVLARRLAGGQYLPLLIGHQHQDGTGAHIDSCQLQAGTLRQRRVVRLLQQGLNILVQCHQAGQVGMPRQLGLQVGGIQLQAL